MLSKTMQFTGRFHKKLDGILLYLQQNATFLGVTKKKFNFHFWVNYSFEIKFGL